MSDNPNEEKKIIIDEDWKGQVQAEKEAAENAKSESPATEGPTAAADEMPLPPANLQTLASMLATQAMVSLGAIANPITGKPDVQLGQAKHFIDMLAVLEEKTKGNCSPEESNMFVGLLHDLRMAFVHAQSQPPTPPPIE